MKIRIAIVALLVAVGSSVAFGAHVVGASTAQGTIQGFGKSNAIKDNYIVVFKDGTMAPQAVDAKADGLAKLHKGQVKKSFRSALKGFSVQMSEQDAKMLASDPNVKYVEQDSIAHAGATQSSPTWGLDRIDQRALPLSKSYTYPNTGAGVKAYVIDSGIQVAHTDFGGRATNGYDFIDNDAVANDCDGHGTHVAGTIGGTKYGVAKGVNLVAVRVLDCTGAGAWSTVIAGVDWVTQNHGTGPAVANMSIQSDTATDYSQALNDAVNNSINSGVTYAVIAGNFGADACTMSPGSTPAAITVGNVTNTDTKNSGSSYGACLDIFAPGTNIVSDYIGSTNTATTTMTGTSMAAPHVAGSAALLLSSNPTLTPQQVRDAIIANATSGVVKSPGAGSPNKLLYMTGLVPVPPSTPPTPPNCGPFVNSANVNIPDNATVYSAVAASGCTGNASTISTVQVNIVHTWRGDLTIDLVAPDGSTYRLKDPNTNDSADDVHQTFTVDLSPEVKNGTWQLKVNDNATNDTGYIDDWSLNL
jgi:subtilisin family serine protease